MTLAWLLVALAAVAAATPALTRWWGRNAGFPVAAAFLLLTALLVPAARQVLDGQVVTESVPWVPALDMSLALRLDGLGLVFTLIALVIGALVFVYSTRYLAPGRQLDFYLLMSAFTLSMVGLVLADDLILLFLCWELTSLASFLLIARSGSGGEAASTRTLLVTFVGGLTLLVAVAVTAVRTGTTNLTDALASPVWTEEPATAAVVAALVAVAGFTKAAQFPFHPWLPDAMAAATPVSAYLHAAAVVKAGIYLMLRFSGAFHDVPVWNVMLITAGLFTAAMAALFAFQKTDLKKLMAYSTVSQLGLITATIGVGTEKALAAATLHTIAHALFKSGLFMMVGVIDAQAGTRDLRRLPPLRRKMPWSFATVVLGTASMAGVPPLLGFVSKESIFTALLEAPGPSWAGPAALAAAAAGAVLTFAYSARIVTGAFFDGPRDDTDVTEAPPLLLVPAAIPIWAGLPLALAVAVFDVPVGQAVRAMAGAGAEMPHFTLWHGVNTELVTTLAVLALGALTVVRRRQLARVLAGDLLPSDGAGVLTFLVRRTALAGRWLGDLVEADHPSRHVVPPLGALAVLLLAGAWGLDREGAVPAAVDGLWSWVDVGLLVIVVLGVVGVAVVDSRVGGAVFLGAVGITVTVQLFALGAPDVGLTQLLVEMLTVTVIMLVLRKLPVRFGQPRRPHRRWSLALALLVGTAMGLGTWLLTGRRERSDVAGYYVAESKEVTGGDNIVNVILVEFRALDTLGELSVLGMAGIAIAALLASVRQHLLDPGTDPAREPDLRPHAGRTGGDPQARAALTDAAANAVPFRLLLRLLVPALVLVSVLLFWRGHNEPGGGFIAALVASVAVALYQLAQPTDVTVGPPGLPRMLIGGGVLIALGTGLVGLTAGSFLEPLSGYVLGTKLSSSLVFDLGVYSAVLGLVVVTFALLGAPRAEEAGTGVTERAKEEVG